ncbi:MAG: mitochondrial fission ELM1 family protein [Minwuia sp.]|uniref:mitochondrial fission ELM1 family protein n=1 Tax=Minwuia sp. TaxID=2493630 RepID=UPI003A86AF00
MDPDAAPDCWVMSDGKAGMENQCLGLAEALGLAPVVKRVDIRQPWRSLPPQLWFSPLSALSPASDRLDPPWPDLLIATGRQTVALSVAIRRASQGRTFTVQIQNPTIAPDRFDLIAVPQHDRLTGANVVQTFGALNRIRQEAIETAAAAFAPTVEALPRPLIVVLLGGANKVFHMTDANVRDLGQKLKALAGESGGGLAITPSRRTEAGHVELLKAELEGVPAVWHTEDRPNPYLGWMGLGDAFVVTSDSVNMVSEACGTGKPVYVHHLEGGNAKFARFHEAMRESGRTRVLDGHLADWTYGPLDDTATVAALVQRQFLIHLKERGQDPVSFHAPDGTGEPGR